MPRPTPRLLTTALFGFLALGSLRPAAAQEKADKPPEFPPHAQVLEGFEKVVSSAPGDDKPLWTLYKRNKDQQVYAELPGSFASQKYFIALTVASGDRFAGLQGRDMYVYWRRYDRRLALIEPNVEIRSTGDDQSKASVKRLFTDTVLLDVPIVTMGPGGGPVIDLDDLFVGQAFKFFGSSAVNREIRNLFAVTKAKAFPQNVELAFEVPNSSGKLQQLHYSVSVIPENPSFKPRAADERIGFFTTSYADYGKYVDDQVRTRYINRWQLEKADSSLSVSPPKEPIKFYIENSTPVRYRRWVRDGVLAWNKAFEKVGIDNAVVVEYQDAASGAHMDKDPEDVRYNFVRWLNNDVGTAIGPSRVNPMTGQILDADIVLTDGWIRHFRLQFEKVLPEIATESFSAETLAWLADHPNWDPRVRLARPSDRERIVENLSKQARQPLAGHPAGASRDKFIGTQEFDGLIGRTSQLNGMCLAAQGHAFDVALMRMHMDIALAAEEPVQADKPKNDDKKTKEPMIDGMPESFIGPLLAHLVAHEVGHTLGLRHNFKASALHTLAEMNSKEFRDANKPLVGSVMDYTPINIRPNEAEVQGKYAMEGIGPYDMWAIEYGYTFDADLKPILARVAEPELQFGTDEDTSGPDPLARRYDFGKDPLVYAKSQAELAKHHRGKLIEKFVKDGDSWAKAREGYELTISLQFRSVGTMANWVGGTFVHRDKKGDKNARPPLDPVAAKDQRDAMAFVIENAFRDDAFGLTPELVRHLTTDKWLDGDDYVSAFDDSTWPVHDRIMGLQASTLTMLMNPTTLRRVYDNEVVIPSDQDALTLAELMVTLKDSIWTELGDKPEKEYSARSPMISSLRRNLQKEHLSRLIDLAMPGAGSSAAFKPIGALAQLQLRELAEQTKACLEGCDGKVDPYTKAHLTETVDVIGKALDSQFIYNAKSIGGRSSGTIIILGEDGANDH
ncbi:MAG: zinc-dependent metalloprotease [Planctomycetaceae bacterium]|nr:zinc-dependent metalloprotease [Planctomycetaceae bacterium]